MSAVTSINALPPPRESRGGFLVLGGQAEEHPLMGEILNIDASEVMNAVSAAACAGCAVMFSPSSDGAALGVILYAGQQRHRGWANSKVALQALLAAVMDVATAHMMGGPAKLKNGPLRAR